jgi:GntR family transcriptional regulator
MADMGLEAHSRLLEANNGIIASDCVLTLRSKVGAPYFYLARLRFGGKEAVGLQYSTVLTERCPNLQSHDFDKQSLYDVLSGDYHLVIRQIDHAVSAVVADGQQAKLLRIKVGDPLLLVKTNAYLDDEQIIEYTVSYYRADKYEYHTTHTNLK